MGKKPACGAAGYIICGEGKMSNKIWVIRGSYIYYTGEYFNRAYGGNTAIFGIYDDKQTAESVYEKIEAAAIRASDLNGFEVFCQGLDNKEKINGYMRSHCGEDMIDSRWLCNDQLMAKLTDAEVVEFANLIEINHYRLDELDKSKVVYALWSTQDKQLFTTSDDYSPVKFLIYFESSKSDFLFFGDDLMSTFKWRELTLHGTLAELSDNPLELQAVLNDKSSYCKYDETQKELVISMDSDLFKVNPLLKKPIYEVRPLTLPEVWELEKSLNASTTSAG